MTIIFLVLLLFVSCVLSTFILINKYDDDYVYKPDGDKTKPSSKGAMNYLHL